MKNLTQQRDELQAKVDELNKSLEAKDAEIAGITGERDNLASELESANQKTTEIGAERDDLKSKLDASETKVSNLESEKSKLENRNTELESREQDVEKRASARLAQMQSELGQSPPLETGAPDSGKNTSPTEGLTGLDKAIAARNAKIAAASK